MTHWVVRSGDRYWGGKTPTGAYGWSCNHRAHKFASFEEAKAWADEHGRNHLGSEIRYRVIRRGPKTHCNACKRAL